MLSLSNTIEVPEKIKKEYKEGQKKNNLFPDLNKIKKELQFLKNKNEFNSNQEKYIETSKQTYKDLVQFIIDNNGELATSIVDLYNKYITNNISPPLIVRREDPEKVVSLLKEQPINISFDPEVTGARGDKYANCTIWPYGSSSVAGIKNAFLEGRGMAGPLVTLIAVKQNFENNKLEIPKNSLLRVGDLTRESVRIISGSLKKEDLEFIILRIQKKFFPKENLLENEKNEKVKQIFRGFTFK